MRNSRNSWIGTIGLTAALLPGLAACNAHPLKKVELKSEQEKDGNVAVSINRDVDILFVIDNSRSMGEEQATLARNFGPLIEKLDQVQANYRIAITTTDNGHRYCNNGRDAGNFKLTSCLTRGEDFVDTYSDLDFFDDACANICNHERIDILPTPTFHDASPAKRPWIESINGLTNLADGVSPVEAFQCFAPQGITGCGYEAPLESMRLGLLQAGDEKSEEYDFMRPGAILAVVFVTDEADCSARGEVTEPWDPAGNQALWSPENMDSLLPTSEVCWYAGVECEESPDGSKECWAVDKAANGEATDDPDQAILQPLERYTSFLTEIEQVKQEINPGQELLVAVLTGVPTDYDGGRIYYSDGLDESFRLSHGIGEGCSSGNGKAAPPVRMAEFAGEFKGDEDDVNLYSVCKEDYSGAMQSIADAISRQVRPPCVETCVADDDPVTPGLQHSCQLEEEYTAPNGDVISYAVPSCGEDRSVPEGSDVCYLSLTDADESTATEDDDMSPECVEKGWNLEFDLVRRGSEPAPPGSRVQARCSVSRLSAVDCPGTDDEEG